MGSGDEQYVGLLRALEDAYPGRVVAYVGYNTELEHKVRVGAPSEPHRPARSCADASRHWLHCVSKGGGASYATRA